METSEHQRPDKETAILLAPEGNDARTAYVLRGLGLFVLVLLPLGALWYILHLELGISKLTSLLICSPLLLACVWGITLLKSNSYKKRYGFVLRATGDRLILVRKSKRLEIPFEDISCLQFMRADNKRRNRVRLDVERGKGLTIKGDPLAAEAFASLAKVLRPSMVKRMDRALEAGQTLRFREPVIARVLYLVGGLLLLAGPIAIILFAFLLRPESEGTQPLDHSGISLFIAMLVGGLGSLGRFWVLRRGGLRMDRRGMRQAGFLRSKEIPWQEFGGVQREKNGYSLKDVKGQGRLWLSIQARNAFCIEELAQRALRFR